MQNPMYNPIGNQMIRYDGDDYEEFKLGENDDDAQKRRNKDAQGRNYKCSFCAKTYLSYPALYTHLKNKHAKGPDGNPVAALNAGRGRGRPKKTSTFGPGAQPAYRTTYG